MISSSYNTNCLKIRTSHFFAMDSNITIKNVAMGPSSKESKNQAIPLRFFDWASPALYKCQSSPSNRIWRLVWNICNHIISPSSLLKKYTFIYDPFWDVLFHFFKVSKLCHSGAVASIMIYAPLSYYIQIISDFLAIQAGALAFIVKYKAPGRPFK